MFFPSILLSLECLLLFLGLLDPLLLFESLLKVLLVDLLLLHFVLDLGSLIVIRQSISLFLCQFDRFGHLLKYVEFEAFRHHSVEHSNFIAVHVNVVGLCGAIHVLLKMARIGGSVG